LSLAKNDSACTKLNNQSFNHDWISFPGKKSGPDTQAASANIRLRWNYRFDSDLYVIYTAGQRFASLVAANPLQYYENRFVIKFTYSWRP